jgi:hypothetical protein
MRSFLHRPAVHFARHYVEMVVVMLLGMAVLGLPIRLVVDLSNRPGPMLIEMAAIMTIPMVAWMRLRGHAWRPCHEMAASMILPALGALALLATDLVTDSGSLMALEHSVMFPAMLVAMLLRRSEYTGAHGHEAVQAVTA